MIYLMRRMDVARCCFALQVPFNVIIRLIIITSLGKQGLSPKVLQESCNNSASSLILHVGKC